MKRIALLLLAMGLVAAAFLVPAQASTPKLAGTVGPGFTIVLKKGTAKVTTLKAGTYSLQITDKGDIHTFSLKQKTGGKFNKDLTGDTFTGKKTVKVKLTKGKWHFYCAVHPDTMFGNFTVK